ncbi:MAG: cell wall metabolism sensor histidine kinase WalK [Anaerolineae bacterium]|nr:cell wall metabolism sensor histidine kinase WalK [Anaerolineae bacterium]
MSPRLPYWLKLLLAFLAVIVLAAGGAAVLGSRFALEALAGAGAADPPAEPLKRALLMAALAAGGTALLVALGLARLLSARWRGLAQAAEAMASKRGLSFGAKGGEEARLERSLMAMSRALEQQEALRRQLMADIAHELRTPLTVIRGNLEALLDGIYRPSRETVAPIHEEVLLLARLVDDLRDLALAEAGQLPLHLTRVDLTELVRGVLAGFQAQASERSVDLLLVLPPRELPPVEADADRIRQVLLNLIGNALRHVPQRGRVRVALRSAPPRWVEVRVSDNGPGISPEDLPHVFSRFYRGDRSRALDRGGAGLGLAIARHWVEAHGGSIRVESALGEGTTFIFTLPVN